MLVKGATGDDETVPVITFLTKCSDSDQFVNVAYKSCYREDIWASHLFFT